MLSRRHLVYGAVIVAMLAVALLGCGNDDDDATTAGSDTTTSDTTASETAASETTAAETTVAEPTVAEPTAGEASSFVAEVWADNWFALSINGTVVGEDSVPITTERSFNAETITFEATYPLTIAVEAKDFKETDSGIEYIGQPNQQMGDGGLIIQITDVESEEVVAASDGDWSVLVIHRAPLNTECAGDADPDATCEFEIVDTPDGWSEASFDDAAWEAATVWSEAAVSPKDGYDEIDWAADAALVWGSDLEVDNTVLFRFTTG